MSAEAQEIHVDSRPLPPWGLFPELARYRDLLFVLTLREIQVRYAQTALGIAWVLLQPVGTMLLAWLVLGRMASLGPSGVPYPLFCLVGTQLWTYFSTSFSAASQSVTSHAGIIGKLYFPRIVLPLSISLSAVLDLLVSLTFLALCLTVSGHVPSLGSLPMAFAALVGLVVFTSGVGVLGAALCARYRDLRHVIPFLVQAGFFATPVIYSSELAPPGYGNILRLNPVAVFIETVRAAAFGREIPLAGILEALLLSAAVWTFGALVFQRMQHAMADTI